MSIDPRLIGFADRLDDLDKRIERLETLEYGTLAFPSGGLGSICDIVLAAPAASVTCTPIPAGQRHLMVIVSAFITFPGGQPISPTGKILINGGAAVATYEWMTRQERRWGGGAVRGFDSESLNLAGAAAWETVDPSVPSLPLSIDYARASLMMFIPDPDVATPDISGGGIWMGSMQHTTAGFPDISNLYEIHQGGGFRGTAGAFTSLTFATQAPDVFHTGSRFTVYGL